MITYILAIPRGAYCEYIYCDSMEDAFERSANLKPGTEHHIQIQIGDMFHVINPAYGAYRRAGQMPV